MTGTLNVYGWLVLVGAVLLGWAARDAVQAWVERGKRPVNTGAVAAEQMASDIRAARKCPEPRCRHAMSLHTRHGCVVDHCGCKAIPS